MSLETVSNFRSQYRGNKKCRELNYNKRRESFLNVKTQLCRTKLPTFFVTHGRNVRGFPRELNTVFNNICKLVLFYPTANNKATSEM